MRKTSSTDPSSAQRGGNHACIALVTAAAMAAMLSSTPIQGLPSN